MSTTVKKVLIIKLSALGDVCLALPHIGVIIDRHATDEIWVMTSPAYIEFFSHDPRLKVTALDRRQKIGSDSTLGKMRWVRKMRFDTIYDLQGNRTSRLLVRFSGAGWRVGTQPYPFFDVHPPAPYTAETQQSIFDRLNDTLQAAGLPRAGPDFDLRVQTADHEKVNTWTRENGLSEARYVLLHAGSSPEWPTKQWPVEHFARLAARIEDQGLRCVWIGGEEDRQLNSQLAGRIGQDATGIFSLPQLYLLAKGARFAVTSDSGPMHLLAISGLPVYSFFGPTSWVRSQAAGQGDRVIRSSVSCSPCLLKTCPPDKQHACLNQIEPEEVFDRIDRELGISH
jgi:ADP-heptose:LPS heptosyltransferase